MATRKVYLASYDRYEGVLEYDTATGSSKLMKRSDFERLGVALTFGTFTREDAHVLYAFATEDERRLFRSLIKVSGVGPKIALALLSGISVAAFAQCVQSQDITALTRVPGIGRKTAERLVVEMRDRITRPEAASGTLAVSAGSNPQTEAYGALIALGYRPAEATRLLKTAGPGTHSTEELIRRALQGAVRE